MSDNIIPPKVLGVAYLAFGAAALFAKKPSRALAVLGAGFGSMLLVNAYGQWRGAAQKPFFGRAPLGDSPDGEADGEESLEDAYARTNGVIEKKRMRPVSGIEGRIKEIGEYIRKGTLDPKIREKAMAVLTRKTGALGNRRWTVPEKNHEAEVRAIFDAVRDPNSPISVRYVRDPLGTDTYVSARKTMALRGGDCDDSGAIYIGSLFRSVGYPTKLRVVRGHNEDQWSHIYSMVGLPPGNPTRWIPADPTENRPFGWEPPDSAVAERRDFEV